jgi:DnaJ-class molecular chaperone
VTPPEPAEYDPERCHACRGTGRVISGKGGTPHEVECPWCEGTGRFIPGHDAQAAKRSQPA